MNRVGDGGSRVVSLYGLFQLYIGKYFQTNINSMYFCALVYVFEFRLSIMMRLKLKRDC